jgi:hypothetical protein
MHAEVVPAEDLIVGSAESQRDGDCADKQESTRSIHNRFAQAYYFTTLARFSNSFSYSAPSGAEYYQMFRPYSRKFPLFIRVIKKISCLSIDFIRL